MIPPSIKESVEELLALETNQSGLVIKEAEWAALPKEIREIIPAWYKELTSKYPLAGRQFDIDENDCQQGEICFWEPKFYEGISDPAELKEVCGIDLAADPGIFPFCGLPDGEMLVARGADFESAEILHYEGVFGWKENSALNSPIDVFLARLIPSDFEE
jgi:hypothetical protein